MARRNSMIPALQDLDIVFEVVAVKNDRKGVQGTFSQHIPIAIKDKVLDKQGKPLSPAQLKENDKARAAKQSLPYPQAEYSIMDDLALVVHNEQDVQKYLVKFGKTNLTDLGHTRELIVFAAVARGLIKASSLVNGDKAKAAKLEKLIKAYDDIFNWSTYVTTPTSTKGSSNVKPVKPVNW